VNPEWHVWRDGHVNGGGGFAEFAEGETVDSCKDDSGLRISCRLNKIPVAQMTPTGALPHSSCFWAIMHLAWMAGLP